MKKNKNTLERNLKDIVNTSYRILCEKAAQGNICVDNASSFLLNFGYILKTMGQLHEFSKDDRFSLCLEKAVELDDLPAGSDLKKTRCDIILILENTTETKKCAIDVRYLKKENHREANNRYDYFANLRKLETYRSGNFDLCYLIVGTDHSHYVNQEEYPNESADFDFSHNRKYAKGQMLSLPAGNAYGDPIILRNDYTFSWDIYENQYFLKQEIK